jgi:phosphatidylethanolamine N-methyltransferase
MALLRHVIGIALIALQAWTITSIYESLGEFGWFFGDFFFTDKAPQLTYGGIYRFLNNPERTIGLAGVWGIAIMTWSKSIFFLALLSHTLSLCFIQLIEKPHMQKLYRQGVRRTSGVSRNFKRALPAPLHKWSSSVDHVLDGTLDSLEDFIDAAGPKLAAGFNTFVQDSSTLFSQFPARISVTRLAPDLAGLDPKDYSITIENGTPTTKASLEVPHDGREGEAASAPLQRTDSFQRLVVDYGAPVKLKWTAPLNHSPRDWIGLYRVGDNASREVTKIGCQGRWTATTPNVFDLANAETGNLVYDKLVPAASRKDGESQDLLSGEIEFSGDKLWWTQGVFEFRYHHDGKYNVMAISHPFEIKISRFDEEGSDIHLDSSHGLVRGAVEEAVLPIVQNCFDRDPDVAPRTVDEAFGKTLEREGKYAKRVVYAVQQMFGIEFAPEVVQADGNVRNLAWRICNAKKVLAPYSMKTGATTPS